MSAIKAAAPRAADSFVSAIVVAVLATVSVTMLASTAIADLPQSSPTTRAAPAASQPLATAATQPLAPTIDGPWLRPAIASPDTLHDTSVTPEWGHANGLRVGIAPLPGPRGLLRVYTPYLGQSEPTMLNFIAIEPTAAGEVDRGLSELEPSALDGVNGKRFWSLDAAPEVNAAPRSPDRPARGTLEMIDGVEWLTVFVDIERYANGAHVYLRLRFRSDKPREVAVAVFAHADSRPLAHCVVTATMGNYARLRTLQLADATVTAGSLWPDLQGDGFSRHAAFPVERLRRDANGDAIVAASPDESDPAAAIYARGTRNHWHYAGVAARQTWRMPNPHPKLHALVNGRVMYWASQTPIPGGVAFENFEMVVPFFQGQEFWYGAEPLLKPAEMPH